MGATPKAPEEPLAKRLATSVRYTIRTAKLVYRVSPKLATAYVSLTLGASGLPLAVAWIGKKLVDAVVAHDEHTATKWVGAELAVVASLALVMRGSDRASPIPSPYPPPPSPVPLSPNMQLPSRRQASMALRSASRRRSSAQHAGCPSCHRLNSASTSRRI